LAEATAAAEQGVELARLAGNPPMLLWAQCALASARLAAGDVGAAVQYAEDAAASGVAADFHAAGQPAWALGAALASAGEAERGAALLRDAEVLPADRQALAVDLADARGEDPAKLAAAIRAMPGMASAGGRDEVGGGHAAPFAAARARLADGRAFAAAGDRSAAVAALLEAEEGFASFGAQRRRDEAVRELRRLGHRVRARPAAAAGDGALTAREREIAELVAAGRTNREVAAQLVLSERTIEAHLRNVYAKLGVRSRVELTRLISDRSDVL
jgi:DNA-binding CsgD family transcriptional regulator